MTRKVTLDQYIAEAEAKFGSDRLNWKFVCPACGHVSSAADYKAANAPEGAVGFSCVGRWTASPIDAFSKGQGPCNYAGGGLFCINPVEIEGHGYYFEFASDPIPTSSLSSAETLGDNSSR